MEMRIGGKYDCGTRPLRTWEGGNQFVCIEIEEKERYKIVGLESLTEKGMILYTTIDGNEGMPRGFDWKEISV